MNCDCERPASASERNNTDSHEGDTSRILQSFTLVVRKRTV